MFGNTKSAKVGRHIARECSYLIKDITNYLISNNIPIKTHDTLYIFQQTFCFTV